MEPMSLGSPVASQVSPSSPGFTSPYLPEFLMGESTPGSTTAPNTAGSPRKASKHVSFGSLPTMRSSTPDPMESRKSSMNRGAQLLLNTPHTSVEKSGPPTRGLFDTLTSPTEFHTPTSNPDSSFHQISSLSEMSHHDTTWTEIEEAQNTWVTVFGFPPSAASYILSQFSHYGKILEKRMPAKGNWMHIRYQTKLESRKALSNSGKVFGGTIMIGVMLCKDQEILNDIRNKENAPYQRMSFVESTSSTSGTRGMPNQSISSPASFTGTPNRLGTPNLSYSGTPDSKLANIRPLGQAYRMAQADSEVLAQTNIPRRSTSMVSKAMEYVFGW
ncbi:Nucleoporin NUP53 [Zootermopsis nevadensis]|uniref:Nucleoporin NUP53 n=1 Tax=Zootermopsis nevadensis TaxID=136037 RepID=A0A067QUU3_ZOONE|nr:Nucleoporin NUP53 [Zootermopsis nevadensis]